MHDVVRDDLDIGQPLARRGLHQPVLAHPDLALGVPGATAQRRHEALGEHLRVPVVGLEEQHLPARLQEPVNLSQVLGVAVMAEDGRSDDIVEGPLRQRAEVVHQRNVGAVDPPLCRFLGEVGVEHGGRDRVLAPQHRRQALGPESAAGADLEDRLTGKHVEAMPNGDGTPMELDRRRRGVAEPVRLPRALHPSKVLDQRYLRCLPTEPRYESDLRACFSRKRGATEGGAAPRDPAAE